MALSIIGTGYGAWTMAKPSTAYATGTDTILSYDTTTRTLDDYGIALSATGATGQARRMLRTQSTATGESETPTVEYSSTSLSIFLLIDVDVMAPEGNTDYVGESLYLACYPKAPKYGYDENQRSTFGESLSGQYGVGYWLTYLPIATLYVEGYPNVYFEVPVALNAAGELELEVGLAELYNLLSPCKQASAVELVLSFTPTGAGSEDPIYAGARSKTYPTTWEYVFEARLKAQ